MFSVEAWVWRRREASPRAARGVEAHPRAREFDMEVPQHRKRCNSHRHNARISIITQTEKARSVPNERQHQFHKAAPGKSSPLVLPVLLRLLLSVGTGPDFEGSLLLRRKELRTLLLCELLTCDRIGSDLGSLAQARRGSPHHTRWPGSDRPCLMIDWS